MTGGKPQPHLQLARRRNFQSGSGRGEAQAGNLVALDVLTQRDVIRKTANLRFETFRMENHLRRQTALHDVPESEKINPRSHVAMQVRFKDILLFSKVLRSY